MFFITIWGVWALLTGCEIVFPERKSVTIEGVVEDTLGNRLESVRVLVVAAGGFFGNYYSHRDTVYTNSDGIFRYSKKIKDSPINTSVAWYPDTFYSFHKFGLGGYEVKGCREISLGKKCREKVLIVLKDRSQVTGFLLKQE